MPPLTERGSSVADKADAERLLERAHFYATNLMHAGDAALDPFFAEKVKTTCHSAVDWLVDELIPALAREQGK